MAQDNTLSRYRCEFDSRRFRHLERKIMKKELTEKEIKKRDEKLAKEFVEKEFEKRIKKVGKVKITIPIR